MVRTEYNLHLEQPRGTEQFPLSPIVGSVFPLPKTAELLSLRQHNREVGIPVTDVYPVSEDLRFLHDNEARLTPAQKEYYLRENIIAFVEEFAGKIPVKKINGLILPDELQIGGFDMLAAAGKAVMFKQRAGLNHKREQAELEGLRTVHNILQNEGVNGAALVSASKVADYSMISGWKVGDYDSRIGGRPVSEYIFRKEERLGSIEVSKHHHQRLAHLAGIDRYIGPNTAEDMLRAPIAFDGSLTIESLSRAVGITDEERQYSQEYGHKAREVLSPLIDSYIQLVNSYSFLKVDEPTQIHAQLQFQKEAQPLIDRMYSVGVQLRRKLKGELPNVQPTDLVSYSTTLPLATIQGGSQCPSWTTGSKTADVMGALVESGFGISEARRIMMGLSKDNIVYVNGVKHLLCECPESGCSSRNPKRKVLAPIVHDMITCPCCHASAPYKC